MKKFLLPAFLFLSFSSFAQTYRTVDAPIGFLRDEPKVTANIIFRLEEKTRVRIIEQVNKTWSKVEYKHHSTLLTGYITNHTLNESTIIRKKVLAGK